MFTSFLTVCQTLYKLFPRNLLGGTRVTALDVRSFTPTEDAEARLTTTGLKSPRNHFLLVKMIQIYTVQKAFGHTLITDFNHFDQ